MGVRETIEKINILIDSNALIYQGNSCIEPFFYKFNRSATLEEINEFEKDTGYIIPDDYKEFLLFCNGIEEFSCVQGSFFSLEDIKEIPKIYKDGVYPIAYINGDNIVINSAEISSGKYIYAGCADATDEFIPLNINFETFFNRMVLVNGELYWSWLDYDESDFVDFSE